MQSSFVRLAPDFTDLAELGVDDVEQVWADPGSLGAGRVERVSSWRGRDQIRFSLPGQPLARVRLERFSRPGWRERFEARFTAPRSLSRAEREWNLICHLRAHGVGTPEPLAVGRSGTRSFLISREPQGVTSLAWILRADVPLARRRRIARAVGFCLARVLRSGTFLPELYPQNILIGELRAADETEGCLGMRFGRLPEVVLMAFQRGRIYTELAREDVSRMVHGLQSKLQGQASGRELLRAALSIDKAGFRKGQLCSGPS